MRADHTPNPKHMKIIDAKRACYYKYGPVSKNLDGSFRGKPLARAPRSVGKTALVPTAKNGSKRPGAFQQHPLQEWCIDWVLGFFRDIPFVWLIWDVWAVLVWIVWIVWILWAVLVWDVWAVLALVIVWIVWIVRIVWVVWVVWVVWEPWVVWMVKFENLWVVWEPWVVSESESHWVVLVVSVVWTLK